MSSSVASGSSARILRVTESSLEEAAERIRKGLLVAFPTETVFGLGANALSDEAVRGIFAAKARPLTDPVLAHVHSVEQARSLLALDAQQTRLFDALTSKFWPGPLTLLGPASALVPPVVTAGTGVVGVRLPNHATARRLIELSGVPIAAPSANRFGHVSPTTAGHVMDDLGDRDVLILDDGNDAVACEFGIESTIVQLLPGSPGMRLVRRGAISEAAVRAALVDGGLAEFGRGMTVVQRAAPMAGAGAQEAPGQLLTHYSPDVDAFVLVAEQQHAQPHHQRASLQVSECVVIDFGAKYKAWAAGAPALKYLDLSPSGDASEAATGLFAALREAEGVKGAKAVLLPDLRGINDQGTEAAVFDRIFRAASGRFATPQGLEQVTVG
jgi:L-threonylcarbamoyladenylate synthase